MKKKRGGLVQPKLKPVAEQKSINSHSEETPPPTETSDGKVVTDGLQNLDLARLAKAFSLFVNDYNKNKCHYNLEKQKKPKSKHTTVKVSPVLEMTGRVIRYS